MKKTNRLQKRKAKTQLHLAIWWIIFFVMMVACKSNGGETNVDCNKIMDQALEVDALTGEVWFSQKDRAVIRQCGMVDNLDMTWLMTWFLNKTNHDGFSTSEPITYRMMMEAVDSFRESPDYAYVRSILVRRERINKEQYNSETWVDAKQYYLDLNWSLTRVDSFRVFLEDPENEGLTYLEAVNAFLWSTEKPKADPF